jgi:outer membrane protein assembly factor BamB
MRLRTVPVALLCAALAACSGGGGGTFVTTPLPPWGKFRHDTANSGAGGGPVADNDGTMRQFPAAGQPPLAPISASPAIGTDHTIYFGTEAGELYALTRNMTAKWSAPFTECALPGKQVVRPGSILSSPAVTSVAAGLAATDSNDKILYFGGGDGRLYAVQDRSTGPTCLWTFPPPPDEGDPPPQTLPAIVSSPTFLIDSVEGIVTGVYFGTAEGVFYALNGDGTIKWRYPPPGEPSLPPITSSPALQSGGPFYFTAADGNLYALSLAGTLVSPFPLPVGTVSDVFASSPAIGTNIYVATEDGTVVAKDAQGNPRWTFVVPNGEPVTASVAIGFSSLPAPSPTPGPPPPITPGAATPTPSPTPNLVLRPLVLALARDGMLYPIDDGSNGELAPGIEQPAGGAPSQSSPLVTSDGCIVFADDDGLVHIRQLRSSLPSTGPTPTPTSTEACTSRDFQVTSMPIRSSPAIDTDGVIIVGADDGYLYAIGTPG